MTSWSLSVPRPQGWPERLGRALTGAHGRLIYSAFGFAVGLVNLVVLAGWGTANELVVRILFAILGGLVLTLAPYRPAQCLGAFGVLFLVLVLWPGTYASDLMLATLGWLLLWLELNKIGCGSRYR